MPNSVPITLPTTPPSPLPHSRLARSHNRRFHVRFPGVDSEEHLLNYYSCALVADILLQGHLYITENYFAFYSNIFGRKTQILLPVSDVIKVTKERTAKIIPNAVGLYTVEGKYVFGSLLSRNTTYRLMHHVWLKSADPDTTEDEPSLSEASEPGTSDEAPPISSTPLVRPDDLPVRRLSRRKSDLFPRISAKAAARRQCAAASTALVDQITLSKCHWDCSKGRGGSSSLTAASITSFLQSAYSKCFTRIEENVQNVNSARLVFLFLLATVLVYRVSLVHSKSAMEDNWPAKTGHRLTSYLELLKQQQEAVEEEILRITTTLKNRLNDLGQVRQSIDKISGLTRQTPCNSPNENSEASTAKVYTTS
ncbi:hypothetical protein X975_04492, partial [Stegodyphus mimosarum]